MVKNILSDKAFWMLNKALTLEIGINASLLLSDLSSKQDYFHDRNMLDEDGFFFNTREAIKRDTSLSSYQQNEASKDLIKLGLISINRKDVPPKNWYKVHSKKVNNYINDLLNTP